ncbi:uncharacterized protein [Rutidosis leptorrhynchoides]|uniref:uncharacterized protein isoform X4 n=1 Tax=Rutidosis leptorrhynchoides TaxID=125765 RepID=UPI003A995C91
MLRSYVSRKEGVRLLGLLVKGMLTDFGDDMHCQFLEIIRSLLESFSSAGQRDAIVEVFYERHLDQLISVIVASCLSNDVTCVGHTSKSSDGIQATAKPEILLNICDLLCKHPQGSGDLSDEIQVTEFTMSHLPLYVLCASVQVYIHNFFELCR